VVTRVTAASRAGTDAGPTVVCELAEDGRVAGGPGLTGPMSPPVVATAGVLAPESPSAAPTAATASAA
jgi:hypothetical protein